MILPQSTDGKSIIADMAKIIPASMNIVTANLLCLEKEYSFNWKMRLANITAYPSKNSTKNNNPRVMTKGNFDQVLI